MAFKKLQRQAGGMFRIAKGGEMAGRAGTFSGLKRQLSTSGAAIGKGHSARKGALNSSRDRIYGLQDDVSGMRSRMMNIISDSTDAGERAMAQKAIKVLDSGGKGKQPWKPKPPVDTTPKPPKEGALSRAAKLTGYGTMGAVGLYGGAKYHQHRQRQKRLEMMGY
jgi:hypothetical protein